LKVAYNILSISILSVYLVSLMGIGRYSCGCEHSSSICLFGIHSECNCHNNHHVKTQKFFRCVCGAILTVKEPEQKDCCKVNYYFLKDEQNIANILFVTADSFSPALKPLTVFKISEYKVERPIIKSFQALFQRVTGSLFKKFSQFIL